MGLREDALRNNENTSEVKKQKVVPGKRTSVPVIHNKKQKKHYHRNLNQIFILSLTPYEKERRDLR